MSGTTSVQVKPCLPTCGITASPLPAKAGKPFTVDVSGSRVAAGVKGGVKTAKVEVVDPKGAVVGTYDIAAPNFVNNAVVIKKGGIHTLRAVVVDEAGQTSTNACTAQVDVKGGLPIYLGAYFGKERFVHDEVDGHDDVSRPRRDLRRAHRPRRRLPADARRPRPVRRPARREVQLRGQRAHVDLRGRGGQLRRAAAGSSAAALSYWDIGKDSGGIGLLLQGGFDLDKDGKWQLVGQARAPFSASSTTSSNNYQFWGGIRFRPNSWK